jgi:hypothetical protein
MICSRKKLAGLHCHALQELSIRRLFQTDFYLACRGDVYVHYFIENYAPALLFSTVGFVLCAGTDSFCTRSELR